MLLVNRQQLLTKALDIEKPVRGSLKVFGLRVRVVVLARVRGEGICNAALARAVIGGLLFASVLWS